MKTSIIVEFAPDESELLSKLASQRGFDTPGAYIWSLVAQDAQTVQTDDDEGDPVEDFRQAWREIKRGDVMSVQDFVQAMGNDG
jgi:hypothetical protein